MPKLLWVALPLLAAVAWLAVQALRGRLPSRHALNVASSLLLIVYVGTTAGLGIFWVANQQLPVFDWHYLFGYTTVLLVVLHLSFNFPIVWRFLTRSRGATAASVAGGAGVAQGRRRMINALGLLAGAGAAFVLGMRHGRSELRVSWPAPAGAGMGVATPSSPVSGLEFVERYHAFSSTSRSGVLLRAPGVDWGDPPPPFKRYPGARQLPLPSRAAEGTPRFDLAALGTTLWHTAGVTAARAQLKLRAAPSAGALFSTELYVATRAVPGSPAGLWHYDPEAHALQQLAKLPVAVEQLGLDDHPALRDAAALVIATAIFRRSGHKYRDRAYRYVLADLGHALENLRVAAGATGAQALLIDRFDESRAAAALGIDEAEEGALAVVALGGHAASASAAAARLRSAEPDAWFVPSPSPGSAWPLGVTNAMHLASSLRARARVAAPVEAIVLPAAARATANTLDVIAARRSVRRFAATPLALEALAGVLHGMVAGTAPLLSPAVRVNIVVNAVTGVPPGAYRYEPESHRLLARRASADLRAAARAAALNQDVIGEAAAVLVLSIDRAVFAADPAGPARGYRHAFLETGLVGERVYLEAGARGLGACAVGAFYDDQAAALVAIDPAREWVLHFAALGVK